MSTLKPVVLGVLMLSACTSDTIPARAAWIQQELVAENELWIQRNPDWVAAKFLKMVEDPYDHMRGTTRLFYRDILTRGEDRAQTRFALTRAAATVMIVGDPHPENFGTLPGTRETRGTLWGFNDLDGSNYGPYILDVRRMALGIVQLASSMSGCDALCLASLAERTATGYILELERLATGLPPSPLTSALHQAVEDEALEEGQEQKRFNKYIETTDSGQLRITRFDGEDFSEKTHADLSAEESAQLHRLIEQLNQNLGKPLTVIDGIRRYGSGVNSLPAVRFIALVKADDEPFMLEVREVRDPVPSTTDFNTQPLFGSNIDRLRIFAEHFWSPRADPHFYGLSDGPMHFRTRTYNSWAQGFDHEKVIEAWEDDEFDFTDLNEFAEVFGRSLAQAHASGQTADGEQALNVILADLQDGGPVEFLHEIVRHSGTDFRQLNADRETLAWLIDNYGPILGGGDSIPDFK